MWASGPVDLPRGKRWWNRPTIREQKRLLGDVSDSSAKWDKRWNDELRLPDDEKVALGGLVLTEAFTPATIGNLYSAIDRLPSTNFAVNKRLRNDISARRNSAAYGGWQQFAMVRRPGRFMADKGFKDPTVPDGIDAIWLTLFYPTPSLTLLVATFALNDSVSDLSEPLRTDYASEAYDVRVVVLGPLGRMRQRIPWSRPAKANYSHGVHGVEQMKERACAAIIDKHEARCWDWLSSRFPGRFSLEARLTRPVVRILLTENHVPFSDRYAPFRPVALDYSFQVWRSYEEVGWAFTEADWPRGDQQAVAIVAARRADAAKNEMQGVIDGTRTWSLTQRFHRHQSPLIARWVLTQLIPVYATQLAQLRDRAVRLDTPLRSARNLNAYLKSDGLNVATLAEDIDHFTKDLVRFRHDVVEYREDYGDLPDEYRSEDGPAELVEVIREHLRNQAHRMKTDGEAAITNIGASAQMLQSIESTRLQRILFVLTMLAVAISLVALVFSEGLTR